MGEVKGRGGGYMGVGDWGGGGTAAGATCLVVAGVEDKGVGEGAHSSTGKVEHCGSNPVDASPHWHLPATNNINLAWTTRCALHRPECACSE